MVFLLMWLFFQGNDPLPPALRQALESQSEPNLVAIYNEHRAEGPQEGDESFLNGLGYYLLRVERSNLALDIFELNVSLFPDSANALDSLAEANLKIGEHSRAVDLYKRAFDKSQDRGIWRRLGTAYSSLDSAELELAHAAQGMLRYQDGEALDVKLAAEMKHGRIAEPNKTLTKAVGEFPKESFWRLRQAMRMQGGSVSHRADGWQIGTYESAGLDGKPFHQFLKRAASGAYENLHGVVVVKNGKIIGEGYFDGFSPDQPHDTRSTGKSIVALLAGIAVDQGALNIDESIYNYFPAYRKRDDWDPKKDAVYGRHLLGMSSGLDAFDNRDDSPGNENYYQENLEDWIDNALRLPLAFKPGDQLIYASANYLLAGDLIAAAVKTNLDDFSKKHLFSPIDMTNYRWFRSPNGKAYGAGGIRVTPRDLAKFGQLIVTNGLWQNKRIVSKAWIKDMTKPQFAGELWDKRYGLGWYVHQVDAKGRTIDVVSAAGNGGQRIWAMPQLNAVLVTTMGNYNSRKARIADDILKDILIPSLIKE